MHRYRRHVRRMLVGLGFLATVAALAALVTGGIVGGDSGSTSADSRTQTYDESGQSQSGKNGTPSLSQRLKDAAQAQLDAEQKTEDQRQDEAQAEKERQAQAEKDRKAEGESEGESEPQAQGQDDRKAEGQSQPDRQAQGQSGGESEPQTQDDRQAEREAAAESSARSAERAEERAKSDPKSAARDRIGEYDWDDSEFACLEELWTNESQWDYTAENPSSGALGIPQSLPPEKMAESGDDYETNPITQIEWGLDYIDDRYGSPCAALDFWNSKDPHWY